MNLPAADFQTLQFDETGQTDTLVSALDRGFDLAAREGDAAIAALLCALPQ